ncbi:MAG TPA: dienelactone hydrolase family protein [Thermoanaerobaculia bacterium]|nr:dienelactone hydrolase family protein [Thermoanaerobaculia bacterium]
MSARVLAAGSPLGQATAAMILVHGRGAPAEDILGLGRELGRPDLAYLAPQAEGYSWYPYSFMAPMEKNEPGLSNGLTLLGHLVERLGSEGIPPERTVLLGFSQGACLSLEYAARNARRFGAVVGLSGGLIGPPGTPRDYSGSFDGTPVFLGCSDRDPHIPLARVQESTEVLTRMGASVTERIYPAMGHTVSEDELKHVRSLLAGLPTS